MDIFPCSGGEGPPPVEDVNALLTFLNGMRAGDPGVRRRSLEGFLEFARHGVGPETGKRALEEAAKPFPASPPEERESATEIVQALSVLPDASFIEPLVRHAKQYPPSAVGAGLTLLTCIEQEEAARAFLTIVKENATRLGAEDWNVREWQEDPMHEEILFPELFAITRSTALESCAYELALYYAKVGALDDRKRLPGGDVVADYLERRLEGSFVDAIREDPAARWAEEFAEVRWEAGLLLDLLGYLQGEAVLPLLRRHVESRDPRLACFAVLSLLRRKEEVATSSILRIAADPEMRNWFHEELRELDMEQLFPADSRTLESYAEADVVNWLVQPMQLGRAPDELVLDSFHEIEDEHGKNDYALFRFRTKPPHWAAEDGWLAAIAGPFEGRKLPEGAMRRVTHTSSNYNPWDALSPREHVIDILKMVRDEDFED